ncbi:MAG TPA: VapC toxin family PIN domain ribonuclease [Trebonia sp.]|nr:VapC toxin family PIN domain ribonuclease [Trebonia sp.]
MTVLAETCYLIDRTLGPTAEAAFLDSVGMGPDYTFQLVELVDSDLRRMSVLVRQYADLRLGGTDASVVAICERLGIVTVATVSLRDFATVRPRHIPAFITVPGLD